MNIKEQRKLLGDTQKEFSKRYGIPFRTIQNWESNTRVPPNYILDLIECNVKKDVLNHKTIECQVYHDEKKNLPKRSDFIGCLAWLRAVNECLGENVVFALDEALMCQGNFGGRNDEYLVWIYGDQSLEKYNGVVILGNHINDLDVLEKNGLKFTNFNRTIHDSLTNESILDTQGITEAISKYYYTHNESFDGIFVVPEYQERFLQLANDAIEYYED